jgi:hypothetical protein
LNLFHPSHFNKTYRNDGKELLKIDLIHFFLNFFLNTATTAAPDPTKSQVAGSETGDGAVSSPTQRSISKHNFVSHI